MLSEETRTLVETAIASAPSRAGLLKDAPAKAPPPAPATPPPVALAPAQGDVASDEENGSTAFTTGNDDFRDGTARNQAPWFVVSGAGASADESDDSVDEEDDENEREEEEESDDDSQDSAQGQVGALPFPGAPFYDADDVAVSRHLSTRLPGQAQFWSDTEVFDDETVRGAKSAGMFVQKEDAGVVKNAGDPDDVDALLLTVPSCHDLLCSMVGGCEMSELFVA